MDHSKAHPAEAATREKSEFVDKFRQDHGIPDIEGYLKATHGMVPFDWAIASMIGIRDALSTHQQQGRDIQEEVLDVCQAGELSRAPQPDTVTEEMVTAGYDAFFLEHYAEDGRTFSNATRAGIKAALTAALSAKGK